MVELGVVLYCKNALKTRETVRGVLSTLPRPMLLARMIKIVYRASTLCEQVCRGLNLKGGGKGAKRWLFGVMRENIRWEDMDGKLDQ